MKNLVLVGGGHAHLAVLKNFGLLAPEDARVTLISRDRYAAYSGLLPGLVAGHNSFEDSHIDLARLARFARARFIEDEVTGIDPDTRLIQLAGRSPFPYDLCSVNTGSVTPAQFVPGAEDSVTVLRPISRFLRVYQEFLDELTALHVPVHVGFVGGGAGSIELMLSMQYAARRLLADLKKPSDFVRFSLFEQSSQILCSYPAAVRRRFYRLLSRRHIHLYEQTGIVEAGDKFVETDKGARIALDRIFLVTGAVPPPWLETCTLAKDDHGFIAVDDGLMSISHNNLFAAGDVAGMIHHAREKAGVIAVRQGPVLVRNLRRALKGQAPLAYRPQSAWLSLISTGNKGAVLCWRGLTAQGYWVWLLKQWIDRSFTRSYNRLLS